MIKKFKYFQKGFSLVEAMVALAILAVGILFFMQTNTFQSFTMKTDRLIERSAEVCNYLFEDLTAIHEQDLNTIGVPTVSGISQASRQFTITDVWREPKPGDQFLVQGYDKVWTVSEFNSGTSTITVKTFEEDLDSEAGMGSPVKFIKFITSAIDDYRIANCYSGDNTEGDCLDLTVTESEINTATANPENFEAEVATIQQQWQSWRESLNNMIGDSTSGSIREIRIECDEAEGICNESQRVVTCSIGNQMGTQQFTKVFNMDFNQQDDTMP